MAQKLYIILFCVILPASANSQSILPHIYVGEINCGKANEPQKTDREKSITIFTPHLMDSANAIDIFLTEHGIGPVAYTRQVRLSYNKEFKIEYWDTDPRIDTVTFQFAIVQKKSSLKYPLDSIFSLLIAAGAFHLPHFNTDELLKNHKLRWLTTNKREKDTLNMVVDDGSEFLFEYKIGNCYGRHIFNNPQILHENFPDVQIFREQAEIVHALFLNLV